MSIFGAGAILGVRESRYGGKDGSLSLYYGERQLP